MSYTLQFTRDAIEDIELLKKAGDKATLRNWQPYLKNLLIIHRQEQDNRRNLNIPSHVVGPEE